MKSCNVCDRSLPTTAFYESNKGTCKECVRARASKNRWDNIEHRREYDRQRGQLPHRKEANKARNERYDRSGWIKAFIEANPHKRAAHVIVGNAVKYGRITPQPCEWCGTKERIHAHHEDYSKPLDITWLCSTCHGERHRQINEERRQEASP